MIEIGKKQLLTVLEEDQSGYYLVCSDKKEVFLPGSLAQRAYQHGEQVEVFTYYDKNGDILATPKLPRYELGDLAFLKVISTNHHGAFLDWGLPKDLLAPRKLQKYPMKINSLQLVKILHDSQDRRLYASSFIDPYIEQSNIPLNSKDSVSFVPFYETPLGFKVLVNQKYLGMIFKNEIFESIEFGKSYKGSVKFISDKGQVDVLIGSVGLKKVENDSDRLLDLLKKAGGSLPINDRSSPDEITRHLKISKSAFKKSLGFLLKRNIVEQSSDGIKLIK